jgi:hypothetical protein
LAIGGFLLRRSLNNDKYDLLAGRGQRNFRCARTDLDGFGGVGVCAGLKTGKERVRERRKAVGRAAQS